MPSPPPLRISKLTNLTPFVSAFNSIIDGAQSLSWVIQFSK